MAVPANTRRSAVISEYGLYRYRLTRTWDESLNTVTWIMLNPSTADALTDDATIRKCIGFAQRWGFGGIDVVNLFAYRSRDPLALVDVADPYGPDYTKHFNAAIDSASLIIAAWGCHSTLQKSRLLRARAVVMELDLKDLKKPVDCLGMSRLGPPPYHPLMQPYAAERKPFNY